LSDGHRLADRLRDDGCSREPRWVRCIAAGTHRARTPGQGKNHEERSEDRRPTARRS
jgi:hypothetical protein